MLCCCPVNSIRDHFVGLEHDVPLLGGGRHVYVNFDNAATTPPFRAVLEHLTRCSEWYSSVHRGTGFKSLLSTHAFARARRTVADFVGADPGHHAVVFCGNTTDAINRLCQRFSLGPGELFLTTVVEHHSNLLPWRFSGQVDYVQAKSPCGMIDTQHLETKLCEHGGRVRLVAVSGASNVTGLVPPLGEIARLCHGHGALLLVDASQLIAHRPIRMGPADDPERMDFLAFSGHKLYAPFGSGALIGPRSFFAQGRPGLVGGGAVDLVTLDDIEWASVPEKEEAGTPNLLGICAMARSLELLAEIGMEAIVRHEQELTFRAFRALRRIPGIRIFGGCEMVNLTQRLGVIPIQAEAYDHALLAAILGHEWGIGVRNGCFCAHPYITHLLGISKDDLNRYPGNLRAGHKELLPGFVRLSFGLYNTAEEVDYLGTALTSLMRDGPRGQYRYEPQAEGYRPVGFDYDFDAYLQG
jgi:selenocysteine lyase/cysteine desulfurase